jgi:hypothetical protein
MWSFGRVAGRHRWDHWVVAIAALPKLAANSIFLLSLSGDSKYVSNGILYLK